MASATGRLVGPLGAGALAVALAACTVNVNTDGATASETHMFKVTGASRIILDTFDGAIEVHAWDRPEVEVVVEKQAQDEARLKDITVEKSQDGDQVTLRVRGPASSGSSGVVIGVNFSPSARLRVAVPKSSALDLRSGDGSITVEEVTGIASLRTDDGSIVASRLSGEVLARTDDGSIRFREITGKVDVETGDGSVVVDGTLTHLRAKTGDGSVRIGVEAGSRVEDDWTVETRDGSVEVRLPEAVDVVVDAVTTDGGIRSNYPGLTVERADDDHDDRSRRELHGTLGAGGRTLRVRTGDGTIRFAR
jgi:putative adhesin